ncbi:MAG: HEPN domain-containing protein, partial [Candidatus Micrarchaeia archaeon]
MSIEILFEEGLLKKCIPSKEKAEKSIEIAEKYLDKAKKVFDHRMDDVAILLAYSSAFHASRAILFKEGVSERSHYAVCEYLKYK